MVLSIISGTIELIFKDRHLRDFLGFILFLWIVIKLYFCNVETNNHIDKTKYINSTTFKKGDNRVRKPKGALSKKTKIAEKLGFAWNDLQPYMEGAGIARYLAEMEALNGRDYIIAYTAMLEYVKPKLARQEIITNKPQQIINIVGRVKSLTNNYTEIVELPDKNFV